MTCPKCRGRGRLTARTELLECTYDCTLCDASGYITSDSRLKREPPGREARPGPKGESGGARRAIAQTTGDQ
jgi:DnaJ-class molecular chaperone